MSGSVETATKRSYAMSDLGARLTLEAERRPPTFSRRRHGRHAGACRRQLGAALRPRARAGLEPQTCEAPSIHRLRCALVCWQVCGPLTAPMASILRHHPGGARQAAPGGPVDDPGAAAATRLRLSSTAQPDIRLHSVGGRRLSGAATEPTFDESRAAVPGSSVGASRSLRRPPSCYRGAAPVAGRPTDTT